MSKLTRYVFTEADLDAICAALGFATAGEGLHEDDPIPPEQYEAAHEKAAAVLAVRRAAKAKRKRATVDEQEASMVDEEEWSR